MAETTITDVIVPELFSQYVIERSAEKSALIRSGIVEQSADFDERAAREGQTVQMPFWNDLSGDDEVLSDGTPLTTGEITADKDIAIIQLRGKAWSVNDLASILAGDDAMGAIVELVSDYWVRTEQVAFQSFLTGVFGASSMSTLKLDIHATSGTPGEDNFLTGDSFVNTTQLLGDSKGNLTAVVMHSAVEASLVKQDLIDFVPQSEGKPMLKKFMGLDVVVDDLTTTETVDSKTVYHTFIFGRGAVAMGKARNPRKIEAGFGDWYTEIARVGLAGSTQLINRVRRIFHLRGVKWNDDTMAGSSPSNAELATAANWVRVYDPKNIRVVRLRHNIAA
jgi:hypothetical protein